LAESRFWCKMGGTAQEMRFHIPKIEPKLEVSLDVSFDALLPVYATRIKTCVRRVPWQEKLRERIENGAFARGE